MSAFELLATPIWVNLLILVPVALFFYWRKNKLEIIRKTLMYVFIFGLAFGVIEATCVIYLRASTGLLPGYHGTVLDVWRQASLIYYNQELLQKQLPVSLLTFEVMREIGTMIMLGTVAFIAANKTRERAAIFLWAFATWDITYYIHLWITVRWPQNLMTPDVLFLIPEPWLAQVWFPILVSSLTLLAIFINIKKNSK